VPRRDQCHDLTFAPRKRFAPPPPLGQLFPLMPCSAVTINGPLNGVEDKATRCVGALGSEELLGRFELLCSEADRAEKPRERRHMSFK
jgi:hypothetical protein